MKKLTKKVWYDNQLWKVEQHIKPTKFNDYLLLSKVIEDQVFNDNKTNPVDMILIDCHNDTFYPNTKEVQKIIKLFSKHMKSIEKEKERVHNGLINFWLSTVRED